MRLIRELDCLSHYPPSQDLDTNRIRKSKIRRKSLPKILSCFTLSVPGRAMFGAVDPFYKASLRIFPNFRVRFCGLS